MQSKISKRSFVAASIVVLAYVQGCGRGLPDRGKVTGKVTYNGAPLTAGTVNFTPQDNTLRAAAGKINADGTYTLTTFDEGDGAIVGKHRVAVVAMESTLPPDRPKVGGGIPTQDPEYLKKYQPKSLIPAKYMAPTTSELTFEVKKGRNSFNIELKD